MFKIFLGVLAVILTVALLTNKPEEEQNVTIRPPAMEQQAGKAAVANANPPHGQPGHRCDIAVGAPLPSSPAPATSPAPAAKTSPFKKQAPANVSINPAHGQPGHRCDIAVGQPLPQS